jgi:P4 family phage/plasmid primase-like protien
LTDDPELKETAAFPSSKQEFIERIRSSEEKSQVFFKTCPSCGYPVSPLKKDAEGKQWYLCGTEKCHKVTAQPQQTQYKPAMPSNILAYSEGEEGSERFNPALFAKIMTENYFFKTDKQTNTTYNYNYGGGIWEDSAESFIKTIMAETLKTQLKENYYRETLFYIKANTYEDLTCKPNKIAIKNGILNLETYEIEDKTPANFLTTQLPITYDPNADCPTIKKFLTEVLPQDQIPQMQELIGYCLYNKLPIHKSAIFLGEGRNGKTTTSNLITAFLGQENVSDVNLQQICEGKFELAQLYGKLANICDDLPSDALRTVGNFKNLTGNAPIQAQFKHKNPFDFWNTAKMIWACNKLPPSSEDTTAYYERFIIFNFDRNFTGNNQDINLLEKLTTPQELSGMLNFALEGVKRLLTNKQFSNSKTTQENRAQYIRSADSCLAFLEECTGIDQETEPEIYISEEDCYRKYIAYCTEHRVQKKDKSNLTKAIQKYRPEAERTQIRLLDKRPRVWKHLSFKESVTTVTIVTASALLVGNESYNNKKENTKPCDTNNPPPERSAVKTSLIKTEAIHYRQLPPSEPHPCDKYGCAMEANYQFGNSYFCDGKMVSHFKEILKACIDEGFSLIEDMTQAKKRCLDAKNIIESEHSERLK